MIELTHIWPEEKVIICNFNQFIKSFLKLFGVEYGNDISQFSVDMDCPGYLMKLIKDLFHPYKIYPR